MRVLVARLQKSKPTGGIGDQCVDALLIGAIALIAFCTGYLSGIQTGAALLSP
jgi:hypothetical protein